MATGGEWTGYSRHVMWKSRLRRGVSCWQRPGVDLSSFRKMDPHLLVGLVNTELRNHCDSLEDLVKTHGLERKELVAKLTAAGYDYREEQNQFR
jgi:hypothetical protein